MAKTYPVVVGLNMSEYDNLLFDETTARAVKLGGRNFKVTGIPVSNDIAAIADQVIASKVDALTVGKAKAQLTADGGNVILDPEFNSVKDSVKKTPKQVAAWLRAVDKGAKARADKFRKGKDDEDETPEEIAKRMAAKPPTLSANGGK